MDRRAPLGVTGSGPLAGMVASCSRIVPTTSQKTSTPNAVSIIRSGAVTNVGGRRLPGPPRGPLDRMPITDLPARFPVAGRLSLARGSMGKLAMSVCFASVALGQNVDRVFNLTNAKTVMSLQEIATTLRTVAQLQQLSVDNGVPTLTIKGTADQIALAEWLVPRLDVAEAANQGPQEYRVSGDSDDVVVVFGLVYTTTNRGVQEIIGREP